MTESQDLFPESELTEEEFINKLIQDELQEQEVLNVHENESDSEEPSENTSGKTTMFPLSRIKNIMKMDPDVHVLSQEAVILVAKATELFLDSLAKETYKNTVKAKRKIIQKKDLEAAIENIDLLCFLEGTLE